MVAAPRAELALIPAKQYNGKSRDVDDRTHRYAIKVCQNVSRQLPTMTKHAMRSRLGLIFKVSSSAVSTSLRFPAH